MRFLQADMAGMILGQAPGFQATSWICTTSATTTFCQRQPHGKVFFCKCSLSLLSLQSPVGGRCVASRSSKDEQICQVVSAPFYEPTTKLMVRWRFACPWNKAVSAAMRSLETSCSEIWSLAKSQGLTPMTPSATRSTCPRHRACQHGIVGHSVALRHMHHRIS